MIRRLLQEAPLASNMGSAIGFIPWLKEPEQLKTLQSSLNEAAS